MSLYPINLAYRPDIRFGSTAKPASPDVKISENNELSDSFVSTIPQEKKIQQTSEITNKPQGISKEEITEIYNKIFDDLYNNSGLIQKSNMQKPVLIFEEEKGSLGGYSIGKNTISINLKAFGNGRYIAINKNNGAAKTRAGRAFSVEEIDKMKKKGDLEDYDIVELTEAERKLYIVSTIAHELRHAVQYHAILHTQGGKEEMLGYLRNFVKEKKPDLPADKVETIVKRKYPYVYDYKPNFVEENLGLISPKKQNGKTCLISSRDFLEGLKEISTNNYRKGDKYYYNNPCEVDANEYSADFISKHPELSRVCRKNVFKAIYEQIQNLSE